MRRRGTTNLDDMRRSLRLGMGPCQGGFCIYRATGILHSVDRLDGAEAVDSLRGFLQERWKGIWPILYGDQLRQARLDDWIFQGLLDVEHLSRHEPSRRDRRRHRPGGPDRRRAAVGGRRARARAREGRRRDASERRDDRRAGLRARPGLAPGGGAGRARRRASVRAGRRARGSARRSSGSRRGSPADRCAATPTSAGSRRTCCCRRRSACRAPRRWSRRRWRPATCARDAPGVRRRLPRAEGLPSGAAGRQPRPRRSPASRPGRSSSTSCPRGAATPTRSASPARSTTPASARTVVGELAARLRAGERVAFPAVLGIADPHAAWSALERGLGRRVLEVPTLPPSVPGMRVFAILREALRRAGGRLVLNNVVVGAEEHGRPGDARCASRVGLREERRGADWVVLATGGFASGGLELDSRWRAREVALGLPVAGVPAERALSRPSTSARTRWPAPAWRSTASCARSTPAASGSTRTSWSRARRWPAPSRGGRSPATASAWPPGTARPSWCSAHRPRRRWRRRGS